MRWNRIVLGAVLLTLWGAAATPAVALQDRSPTPQPELTPFPGLRALAHRWEFLVPSLQDMAHRIRMQQPSWEAMAHQIRMQTPSLREMAHRIQMQRPSWEAMAHRIRMQTPRLQEMAHRLQMQTSGRRSSSARLVELVRRAQETFGEEVRVRLDDELRSLELNPATRARLDVATLRVASALFGELSFHAVDDTRLELNSSRREIRTALARLYERQMEVLELEADGVVQDAVDAAIERVASSLGNLEIELK